jgi:hypothetical protein
MAAEFSRYAEDLLSTAPPEISETVSQIIAEDLKDYQSLNPGALQPLTSGAAGSDGSQSSAQPRPPALSSPFTYKTPRDSDLDSPRGHHEREREHEFEGLFTPSYLPLLDYSSRPANPNTLSSPITFDTAKGKEMVDGQAEELYSRTIEDSPAPEPYRQPVRRNTDEVSIASDRSDGQTRRSALRRSSDSSKMQSPRRVRFDVMGEEVLPTASPQPTESNVDSVSYYTTEEMDGMEELELADGMEDSPPRRRKPSTTDALRALSRQPLDEDGGKWITVSSGPDGEPVGIEFENRTTKTNSELNTRTSDTTERALGTMDDNEDAETVSDDAMADMPPLSPMPSNRAAPVRIPSPPAEAEKAANSPLSPEKNHHTLKTPETSQGVDDEDMKFLEEDDDNLFRFDESGHEERKEEEEDAESDSDSDSVLEMSSSRQSPADLAFSRSPALAIPSRKAPEASGDPNSPSAAHDAKQSSAVKQSSIPKQTMGSYKGHPFNEPIVNEELHAQAASLGAFNSFVGSLSGRSGIDPSNEQSYRESLRTGPSSFLGEPKSMTERMLMEDLIQAEKEKAAKEKAEQEKLERQKAEKEKAAEEKGG